MALLVVATSCGTLSVEDENRLGAEIARELAEEETFVDDPVVARYLTELTAEMVRVSAPSPFDFRAYVYEGSSADAGTVIPGGGIYFTTGLLLELEHVDELAAGLAVQIARVNSREIGRYWNEERSPLYEALYPDGLPPIPIRFFLDADNAGLEALVRAGYEGEALIRLISPSLESPDEEQRKRTELRIRNARSVIPTLGGPVVEPKFDDGLLLLLQSRVR